MINIENELLEISSKVTNKGDKTLFSYPWKVDTDIDSISRNEIYSRNDIYVEDYLKNIKTLKKKRNNYSIPQLIFHY